MPSRTTALVTSVLRFTVVLACITVCGCAANRVAQYTYERRLLADADEKFDQKRYAEALKIYQELV